MGERCKIFKKNSYLLREKTQLACVHCAEALSFYVVNQDVQLLYGIIQK